VVLAPAVRPRRGPAIEPIENKDLPAIATLHAVCFEDAWRLQLLRRIFSVPGTFGLSSRQENEIVGFVLCRSSGGEGEVLSLGVAPAARRFGIARALMESAIIHAVKRGLGALFLEVADDNEAARQLYEVLRFRQVGRRPAYYKRRDGPSVDALTLRRELAPRHSLAP
jgi:ribosomal-protein-alanine N-acetyltransferase